MPVAQVVKQALKRGKRTEFKELSQVPTEIKELPEDARIEVADQFLAADKAEQFTEVRQEDIALDAAATYGEQSKVQAKKEFQQQKIDEAKFKVEQAPEILDAKTNATLQKDKAYLQSNQAKLEAIQERERDLYLKANNLKLERERTATMQELLTEIKRLTH